jgi:uncharacterized protein (TIGR03083 family)
MPNPDTGSMPAIGTADGLLAEVCDALKAELVPLGIDQWALPAVNGLSVRDVVIRLTAVNDVLAERLRLGERAPIDSSVLEAATASACQRDAALTHLELVASFQRSVDHIRKLAQGVAEVGWVGLAMPAETALVDRAFATWMHANDIRNAIGRASLDPSSQNLRVLCELAVSLLPVALATSGKRRGATLQIALTGPGGGEWTLELQGDARPCCAAFMSAAARDLCLLLGDRIDPRDFAYTVRGDESASALVDDLVHSAAAFARL